jgi:tetratricopeptide (TPR) repeat protein
MKSAKRLLFLFHFLPLYLFGQKATVPDLTFDKNFYDCENQWIVFPKKPADSTYAYGVIYIDEQAGFTFDLQGTFKVSIDGSFIGKPLINNSIKYRLEANTSNVSLLNPNRLAELHLLKEPDWLKFYKRDPEAIKTMVSWGRHYNHVGGFVKALVYLKKAYAIHRHADGLEFELAYNYNATEQYDKAIEVLNVASKNDPKNFWYYRELGYVYMRLKKTDDAEKYYLLGLENCGDEKQKSEMAYNMAYGFFTDGNKQKFSEWYYKTKGFTADINSVFLKNLEVMNGKLNGIK